MPKTTRRIPRRTRGLRTLSSAVLTLTVGAGLAACGSSDSDTSTNASGGGAECIAHADDYLKTYDSFPTSLPASPPGRYTELASAPEAGKTLTYISQNFPGALTSAKAAAEAAKALDWTVETVVYDGTIPDLIAKFNQVVSDGPDFITTSGVPAAAIKDPIAAAKKAGISVILNSVSDTADSVPGLAGVINGGPTAETVGKINANMFLRESKCSGNVAVFSLPYPIIERTVDAFTKEIEDNCSSCKVSDNVIQTKDLGTPAATSQMVSRLQASASTKYAYTVIGDIAGGLAKSLQTAGLKDMNIFGQVPNDASIAALRDGSNAWWVNQNSTIAGYEAVDAAARISVTSKVVNDDGNYPLSLLTTENVPEGTSAPVLPSNILDLYKGQWKVG